MKVYVVPSDAYGCGHHRLIWPADVLRKQGFDVHIIPPTGKSGFLAKFTEDKFGKKTLTGLTIPEDADCIVLQRPAHHLQPQMVRMIRSNRVAVVIDMDDDMSAIHRDNVAYQMYRHHERAHMSWRYAADSCAEATLVTTSTPALQKVYAKHGRGVVLDNYIPAAYLSFDKPETGKFGWPGTTLSHPADLQVTGRSVSKLMAEGHEFRVVGGPSKVRQALHLSEEPEYTGSVGPEMWARTVAASIDVGMAPLEPGAFNTAKSRLKVIEMMSVGVPFVASPREEYRKTVKAAGCGLLAETPKDWYARLKRLLTDDVLRKEQAEAGKMYMVGQTYEKHAWRWAEAWTQAILFERGGKQ